jgi:long-chain acyl-CoA synthetase
VKTVDALLERFASHGAADAIVDGSEKLTFNMLAGAVHSEERELAHLEISPGDVVLLEGDFSCKSVVRLLAILKRGCVAVPLLRHGRPERDELIEIAGCQWSIDLESDTAHVTKLPFVSKHPLYELIRQRGHPGLVLFSSGSTGQPKGAVHDVIPLLAKFLTPRPGWRTLGFLLFDHIGGINTLLHTLASGGTFVCCRTRTPDEVLETVERERVSLLPTSPTFLNMVLLSGAYRRHECESLRLITYGTEPMPLSTLAAVRTAFPRAELQQTYGLSELGILRSKSRDSSSLWVRVGGEGFETRVVDGLLEIKAKSAMLGYLNAASPFTEDGWFKTGDAVEVDGEFLRILGRRSELINVAGEKVFPADVESVLLEDPNVADAVVYGETHAITGNIVCAKIRLVSPEDTRTSVLRLKRLCAAKLSRFKVPVKVIVVGSIAGEARFKKLRGAASE